MAALTAQKLRFLLGIAPDAPQSPEAPEAWRQTERSGEGGILIETLALGPRALPALCLRPSAPRGAPLRQGILYCHAHGNRYDIGKTELIAGRPALRDPPLGLSLAAAGYVVLCLDMPGFGARQADGSEASLAKAALWQGKSLLGAMIEDLELGTAYLAAQPEVDPSAITALGISMGGTLAYMLAALTPQIAACAQLCVLADIGPLIAQRAHDLHGLYLTIPGLLPEHDLGDIAALVAPKPHFIATGALDPLTPESAYGSAIARVRSAYATTPERLETFRAPGSGHVESEEMRRMLFRFLAHAGTHR